MLGEAFRARSQIRMLARKLIETHISNSDAVENILKFLCSESGSHDYTINRREAKDSLGLHIDKPNDALYKLIKSIYDDLSKDLELTEPYDPKVILGSDDRKQYEFRRAVIESVSGGCHAFISSGVLTKMQIQTQPGIMQIAIQDERQFDGWKHE